MAGSTRALVLAVLVAVLSTVGSAPATAAPADGTGLIRMMHLSPDTPAVDAYIDSVSDPTVKAVLPAVGYGDVSSYRTVPAGTYTVSARAAGADPASPPVLGTTVTIAPGTATTVAGVGYFADLGFTVLRDDLTLPPAGQSRARVINAAATAPTLDLTLADDSPLAEDLAFARNTDYVDVPGGAADLSVAGGAAPADLPVDLSAGSVYTVLVLDGDGGALRVETALDAAAPGVVPAGGVETGAGGTASASGWATVGLAAAAVSAVALLIAALLGRPGRGRAPRHAAP